MITKEACRASPIIAKGETRGQPIPHLFLNLQDDNIQCSTPEECNLFSPGLADAGGATRGVNELAFIGH